MKETGLHSNHIASHLLKWYRQHHRDLPWRRTKDPYKIWLSEIILQQTRVDQGMAYYHRFVERFPTLEDLAKADTEAVLRLWQGLGYYTRARNLHKCAVQIVQQYNGAFPRSYHALQQLPGVGRYTAAAIASFAFGEAVPAIDGNAIRVLSRLYAIEGDTSAHKTFGLIFETATQLMPATEPDTFNQALMEFGALQCTPASPDCLRCPLNLHCEAYRTGVVADLPVKKKKKARKTRYFTYYVIENHQGILMAPRHGKDIWNGLYEFYLEEADHHVDPHESADEFIAGILDQGVLEGSSQVWKHELTHQIILARFFRIKTSTAMGLPPGGKQQYGWYSPGAVNTLPKPVLIVRYLNAQGGILPDA